MISLEGYFKAKDGEVYKLKRPLYALKQTFVWS